jgi:hypothetical protein
MSKPHWFALQDKFCRPSVSLTLVLGSGEAIYVGTMLSDLDENLEILLNEFGFVFRPDRSIDPFIAASFMGTFN